MNKDIVLDVKTRNIIAPIINQMIDARERLNSILQVVVNTRYPESNDKYELSNDGTTLIYIGPVDVKEEEFSPNS